MRKLIATINHDLDPIPSAHLGDLNAPADPEQICRTCEHQGDRLWQMPYNRQIELIVAGDDLTDHHCKPDNCTFSYRLHSNGEVEEVLPYVATGPAKTEAYVASCGWQSLNKCTTCKNFVRHTVSVWRELWENGPLRSRQAVVGGYCKIGPEGIDHHGVTKHCVYEQRGRDLEPSCFNCKYRFSTNSWHYIDDFNRTVGDIGLDPYLRKQAILAAYGHLSPSEAASIGIPTDFEASGRSAIGLAMYHVQHHNHGSWKGSYSYFHARIHSIEWVRPEKDTVSGLDQPDLVSQHLMPETYVVEFIGNTEHNRRVRIDARRDDIDVTTYWYTTELRAIVRVYGVEAHREFKLTPDFARKPENVEHLREENFATPVSVSDAHQDRIHPKCGDCARHKGKRACYFHAMGITRKYNSLDPTDYEVEINHPEVNDTPARTLRPEWVLRYELDARGRASAIVCDNGEITTAHWQLNRHNLSRLAHEARMRGNSTLHEVFTALSAQFRLPRMARGKVVQPGFGRELTALEPMKEYCAINVHFPDTMGITAYGDVICPGRGIDFRRMLGDRFGMERGSVEYSESWTRKEDEAEWLRAHSIEERVSEEIDTTLNHMLLQQERAEEQGVEIPEPTEPAEWHTTVLDIDGKPVNDPRFWSDTYSVSHDTENFTEYLDEWDENLQCTPRYALYGYSMFRDEVAVVDRDPNSERDVEWVCVNCEATYPLESMGMYDLTCKQHVGSKDHTGKPKLCNGQLVRRVNRNEVEGTRVRGVAKSMPKRRRTGREGAVLADSTFFQQRNRLSRMGCPWWELRGCSDLSPTTMGSLGYDVMAMREQWQNVESAFSNRQSSARSDDYAYFAYSANFDTRQYNMYLVGESMFKQGRYYDALRMLDYVIHMR